MALTYEIIHKKLNLSGNAQFPSGIRQTKDGRGFALIAMSSREYDDNMRPDGTLMYMGHGKAENGDQRLWMNNKKLNDAPMDTPLFVFVKTGQHLKFQGVFKKTGNTIVSTQNGRSVFLFPMKKCRVIVKDDDRRRIHDSCSSVVGRHLFSS